MKKTLDRGDQDEPGRDEDHQPFDAGREVLGLSVTEVVVVVSGSRGNMKRDQGDHRGNQVHQGLGGIREQAH